MTLRADRARPHLTVPPHFTQPLNKQLPLWYQNATGGWAEGVDNVELGWNSLPLLYHVTKG